MFSFVTQISTVVAEKELGLRQALRTMGMTDLAYWSSWGAWEVTLAFISAHLICIFGRCWVTQALVFITLVPGHTVSPLPPSGVAYVYD